MSKVPSSDRQGLPPSSPSSQLRDAKARADLDDPEKAAVIVTRLVEQLHAKKTSAQEKELITARLLGLAKGKKEARKHIGSHPQLMPLCTSLLRNGTPLAKTNVALILSILCIEENVRSKVLIGGCIPPLLSLLKSESVEARRAAAEAIYEVSASGLSDEHVGAKIFVTEGVVPALWDHLNPKKKQDKVVEGFAVGALRNLCGDKESFWRMTLKSGGIDIILSLLNSKSPISQSNAASLLARLVVTFSDSIKILIHSGAIKSLLQLLGENNDISARASAADALESISKSTEARKVIRDLDGVRLLIGAIVSPLKESVKGEQGKALQEHATQALANVCGGMSALIQYLGQQSQSPRLSEPVADIIGVLAYALKIFEKSSADDEVDLDAAQIERILVKLLKPRDTKLIQERILEAMASLYNHVYLSKMLNQPQAKRDLVGLTFFATEDMRERLITCLSSLCRGVEIWEAIGKREGVQILISFLGLSREEPKEYAVEFLAVLTDQVDESKWAVTSAGGIPPLVELLESGMSQKAREDAICVLWNLSCHSEEICACVVKAGAIPAFVGILKNGGLKSQEASAKALLKLVQTADPAVIDQLLTLLLGDVPKSKVHVIRLMGHVLSVASLEDFVQKGSAANNGLRSLVQALASSNEKTKENVASVLAGLFSSRQDLCDSLGVKDVVDPSTKLLNGNTNSVAAQLARALGNLSNPTKKKSIKKMSSIAEGDIKSPTKSAKIAPIESTESPTSALSNLLSDRHIPSGASTEDIVSALTKLLREETVHGKKNVSQGLHQLLRQFQSGDGFKGNDQYQFAVRGLVDLLNATDVNNTVFANVLEVILLLAKTKHGAGLSYPSSLESLVRCLAEGQPLIQDKAIEILSKSCSTQPVELGELLIRRSKSICSLANRIMNSSSVEVKIGGTALLLCAAKSQMTLSMDTLDRSGCLKPLVSALVDMTKHNSGYSSYGIEFQRPSGFVGKNAFSSTGEFDISGPTTLKGATVVFWLLSVICSFDPSSKLIVIEAGGLEAISDRLGRHTSLPQEKSEDTEGKWISSLFLAIMFKDANAVSSPTTSRTLPLLATLLRSDEIIVRYFSAMALASLVRNGNKEISLAIGNSGAIAGLINSLGYSESEMPTLVALTEEFSLVQKPSELVLKHLFDLEEIRLGPSAREYIPLLVNLLRPIPERPDAPLCAVQLLTWIADGSDANKLIMAEAGAVGALAKYLSLCPQDLSEFTISGLLKILFTNPKIVRHESALSSMKQLIGVLHLGSISARCSAANALSEIFGLEKIKKSELAWKAFQPLVEMANSESEQEAAFACLAKLVSGSTPKADVLADLEGNSLEKVLEILSSDCSSMRSKITAARLCHILFVNKTFRTCSFASKCFRPLLSLMQSKMSAAVEAGVCAFERLLDGQTIELTEEYDIIKLLVSLISGKKYRTSEASISALVKLGKDRTPQKLDMVKAGIIDNCLEQLPGAPSSLCSAIADLFRVLTNSGAIARSTVAVEMVKPVFTALLHPDLSYRGQHGALQTLENILEKPQNLGALSLTTIELVTPLIPFLESPSQAIRQITTRIVTFILSEEHFQKDITTEEFVAPLLRLAGIGIFNLQEMAMKALEKMLGTWPKKAVDAGGIFELSKVILNEDPQLPLPLWESAAFLLCNILQCNSDCYYFEVPLVVLVKLLFSNTESTVMVALDALKAHEKSNPSSVIEMVDAGAVEALLDLLKSHHCEESSGRLMEAMFNNAKVREKKICKLAMGPLSEYLVDPQTCSEPSKLLIALALGDLSQHEGLVRSSESVAACRALISLLGDRQSEEMQTVVCCALQNYVLHSRVNRRAVAEAGGVHFIEDVLMSCNAELAGQAALIIKCLFSNHTLQEYMSTDVISALTSALERELWETATVNLEVVRTLNVIFTTFIKLRASEAATLCIPHLIRALRSGGEDAQDSALDTLYLLRHSWSSMASDTSKAQSVLAAEAIPVLQMLIKTRPASFIEKANDLLNCLPGSLSVTIKGGNNLKHSTGKTNAFCRLMIGDDGPSKQTKVCKRSISPEWKECFTWDFAVPPIGQNLHIICKSKNLFRKTTLGTVSIKIDKVLTEGVQSGQFNLSHWRKKDSCSGTLDIEITWSHHI